jgi:hypothetical protein
VDKRRNDEASLCSVSVACPLQNLLHADITYDYPVRWGTACQAQLTSDAPPAGLLLS